MTRGRFFCLIVYNKSKEPSPCLIAHNETKEPSPCHEKYMEERSMCAILTYTRKEADEAYFKELLERTA
ncbi:MAG: hypothetical protein J6I68_00395, partial [Butyrivibrio sp.]|nr:hypothetical protein [Butyrivibrio sp.]